MPSQLALVVQDNFKSKSTDRVYLPDSHSSRCLHDTALIVDLVVRVYLPDSPVNLRCLYETTLKVASIDLIYLHNSSSQLALFKRVNS